MVWGWGVGRKREGEGDQWSIVVTISSFATSIDLGGPRTQQGDLLEHFYTQAPGGQYYSPVLHSAARREAAPQKLISLWYGYWGWLAQAALKPPSSGSARCAFDVLWR